MRNNADKPLSFADLPDATRKLVKLHAGCLSYFPDALAAVAVISQIGNYQHHQDAPLHWDKSKSDEQLESLCRHLISGDADAAGVPEAARIAWRGLAHLQREIDKGSVSLPDLIDVYRDLA